MYLAVHADTATFIEGSESGHTGEPVVNENKNKRIKKQTCRWSGSQKYGNEGRARTLVILVEDTQTNV